MHVSATWKKMFSSLSPNQMISLIWISIACLPSLTPISVDFSSLIWTRFPIDLFISINKENLTLQVFFPRDLYKIGPIKNASQFPEG